MLVLEPRIGCIPVAVIRVIQARVPAHAIATFTVSRHQSGGASETGEDCAELQLHGGRAVVDAVCAELATFEGLRLAEPGEFTRRAFTHGRIDLLQVEGLADLVSAETELQRQAALGLAGGGLSRQVEGWLGQLLMLSARVEALLDFEDEDG